MIILSSAAAAFSSSGDATAKLRKLLDVARLRAILEAQQVATAGTLAGRP